MAKAAFTYKIEDHTLKLIGDWSANTCHKSQAQLKKQLNQTSPVVLKAIDWTQITEVDSSSLAMALWLQSLQEPVLQMIALPEKLLTLYGLYDLDDVLSLSSSN